MVTLLIAMFLGFNLPTAWVHAPNRREDLCWFRISSTACVRMHTGSYWCPTEFSCTFDSFVHLWMQLLVCLTRTLIDVCNYGAMFYLLKYFNQKGTIRRSPCLQLNIVDENLVNYVTNYLTIMKHYHHVIMPMMRRKHWHINYEIMWFHGNRSRLTWRMAVTIMM